VPLAVQENGLLRLHAAEDDATAEEVQLGLVPDDDELERDRAIARGRRFDEQAPVEP
jgi:hypothetical protein